MDAAARLEPFLPEIKERWVRAYRKLDTQSNETVIAELMKISDVYFRTFTHKDPQTLYNRLSVSAERLFRMKLPFENLIASFHFLEETCHPYLERVYPNREDLVEAMGTLGYMCHVCFAAVAEPYLRQKYIQKVQREGPPVANKLTPRETEVLKLVADSRRSREIAEILNLSTKTVEHHRSNIMQKLGLRNIVQLIRYAIKHRIIKLSD